MKMFEEGERKPFKTSKGREKEQSRVVLDFQEEDQDKNNGVEGGSPSTDMARKLREAVKRKKIQQNPSYTGNNPGTNGEVIQDLIKMGHITPEDVSDSSKDTRNEHIVNADKSFTDEDAKTLVKAVYGDDVFERNDKQLKEIKLGDVADSSQVKKVSEQKKDGREKNFVTDRKKATSAIDEQVAQMKMRLKRLDDSSKQFNKVATAEQKEERTKEIEVLKCGIADAENKKAELLEKEIARLELAKKAEAQRLAEEEKKKELAGEITKSKEQIKFKETSREKIGEEKYSALDQFVNSAWEKFITELEKTKIPKRIWSKVWEEEALTYIKERIFTFLREQTAFQPEECEIVYNNLVQKVVQKISEKK